MCANTNAPHAHLLFAAFYMWSEKAAFINANLDTQLTQDDCVMFFERFDLINKCFWNVSFAVGFDVNSFVPGLGDL